MSWRTVRLSDVTLRPQYGAIAKGTPEGSGPRFIRQTDISSGQIDWASVPYCDLSWDHFEKYAVQPGDILVSRLGNGVGNAAVVKGTNQAVFAGYLVRVRAKQNLANASFLGYQLQSPAWINHVSSYKSGAAQPTLNAGQMGEFEFALPPLEWQTKIADTLGALDNKIESNTTMSTTLRSMSTTLFEKWRKESPRLSGSNFEELATVHGGATPRTKESSYWNGNLVWVTPTDVTALEQPYLFDSARKITELGLKSTSAIMHPPGTILMTSRATIGAFAVNQIPAATNQGFIAVRPRRPQELWFLFEEMRARVPEFLDNANGSTFLELSRGRFKELPIDLPSETAIDALHEHLAPLHARAIQLATENARLRTLRDTLLPELLSGRIRVGEAAELASS